MPATNLLRALVAKLDTRSRILARLRARWAKPGEKSGFMASRYFEQVRDEPPSAWIDDKTWRDLEFPAIFTHMDAAVTPVGSQVLFTQLRRYVHDPDHLAQRFDTYARFIDDVPLREQVQTRLWRLEDDSHADLAELLFGERVDKPANRNLILAWGALSIALLVLVALHLVSAWIWLAVLAINLSVIYRYGSRQHRETETMKHCATLLDVADQLAALHQRYPVQPHLRGLHEQAAQRADVRKLLWWFAVMRIPFFSAAFGILNLAFLIGFAIHVGTLERFYRRRLKLAATFALVGGVDAAIAIASFLTQHPHHCLPEFTTGRELSMTDGVHPLLPAGVPNSIRLDRQSLLVTGSNMAGKTTFIKMLACNAILAQTLGFCLASAATIPPATVMASIHGAHSVESGKSHYFAEIEAIDGFLRNHQPDHIQILALDEPFNGTNTVERIAIARAVLESLGNDAIVLATTHDVELQTMLGERYTLYHFQENPNATNYFDYTLRPGPATERNAIRLLERMGFPERITVRAMRYATRHSPDAAASQSQQPSERLPGD